ncbi:MAG: hypothetical protein KJ720_04420 [Proteobacteria bacterium]|nr:hypothetical protein [Pseudomonadota bacterium]MBU1452100.1 hypothetical protein [Pseudomonadota bacterium]MBU2467297.1 hypothetical protein [Pseudomonadota bacterium]MBU2517382.1 hypothetical protein [Pseudomonadota bacterium]
MTGYEVIGKGKDAGCKRRRIYHSSSASEAGRLAEKDGTIVEEINELPPDPPTERQLDYARDIEIVVPPSATKNDVSNLISIKVDKDKPSTARHRSFAKLYGLETTNYIGKKVLFDQIKWALSSPGRENDLASWFTYRVYRGLVKGADDAPIKGPDDEIIRKISEKLAANQSVIKSIRRYEGRDIIWFGEFTTKAGWVYTGGSKRTIAYKEAESALKEELCFVRRDKNDSQEIDEPWDSYEVTTPAPKSPGCFTVLIAIAIILASAYLLA